jgi:GAF domain-containing protein/HAMP domain-containing protein
VASQKDLNPKVRRMWLFLSLGISSYFLGDLIWAYYENILGIDAFPSVADIFYLLFPLLMAAGLFIMPSASLSSRERWRYYFDMAIILITVFMSMWYFIIQPTAITSAGDLLSQIISVAYPIGDMIIIFGIVGGILQKPERNTQSALVYLFAGILFFVGADVAYAYTSLAETYVSGSWIDAGWYIAIALFLFAALRQMYRLPDDSQDSYGLRMVESFFHILPNISIVAGAVLTAAIVIFNFNSQATWLIVGAALSLILLIVRGALDYALQTKFVLAFALTAFVVASAISLIYYNTFIYESSQNFRSLAINAANLAALQQNGDELIRISSVEDPLYEKYRVQNIKIRSTDPRFVFVYTMRKDENGIYFVVDAGEPGEEGLAAFGERYDDASPTLSENFDTMTEAVADSEIYTDKFGSFLSAYAPIFTEDGTKVGVIGIDIDASTIVQNQRQILNQTIWIVVAASLLSLLLGYIAGNFLIKPVKQLTIDTGKFAEGDLSFRTNILTNDEVGKLGLSFNTMVNQIQSLVTGLEQRVNERTADLEGANQQVARRAKQFESISRVTHTISATRDLDSLLNQTTVAINREFGFYHIGIFLLDTAREYAVLSAANSAGGQKMLERSHRLKVGETGMVGFVTSTGRPRIALNTGTDAVFFNNPDLPETRSEIALPLRAGEEIIGALDVQSTEPNAFTQEDINILSSLADQVSIAIQNARQYEETRKALAESNSLSKQFIQTGWSRFTHINRLEGIRHTSAKSTLLYRQSGMNQKDEGHSDKFQLKAKGRGTILSLPVKLRGEVIGSVDIHSPENRRWDQDELDIVTAILERSAIAMENARLLADSQKLAAKERTIGEISSKISAQSNVDELLKIAAQELGRTLPGMEISVQLKQEDVE